MKVALITDIHFGVRNGSKFFLNKYEQFFDQTFFPTLKERNITDLIIMGDTWEYRTKIDSIALYRAQKMFFDRLEEMDIKVTIIYGNHDVAFKNTNEVNTIDFLGKMYKNIHVVREFETIDFDGLPINFISWINNENYNRSVEFIRSCPPTILCGHFEIKSFEMIKGHVCAHGFEKTEFDRFDKVFSGHFHTVSSDGRIFYISNPFQTNWSDFALDKGFRIFDTKTQELEFIANDFEVYDKIAYNDDINILDFDYEAYRDKIVRVYVQSFAGTNRNKLNLFVEKMQAVTYSLDITEVDETSFVDEDGNIEYVDNDELIQKYILDVVQNPNIDSERLLSMFREIHVEALSMVETE